VARSAIWSTIFPPWPLIDSTRAGATGPRPVARCLATIAAAEMIRRSGYRPSLFRLDDAVGAVLVFVLWPRMALQDIATNSDGLEKTRS
jgi:hypothetical protein